MKKTGFAAAIRAISLVLLLLPSLLAAAPASQGGGTQFGGEKDSADVVVLLDVSKNVLPYFQDVTDYVVSSVIRDFLRYGDTFHLLSYGESAQVEIAERMAGERDVKSVLGRLYLLYPLSQYSDLIGAFGYLYQYLADLPESRQKVVVVITGGVQAPSPSSSSFALSSEASIAAMDSVAGRIRANGWPVHIIEVPFKKDALAVQGGTGAGSTPSAAAGSNRSGTTASGSAAAGSPVVGSAAAGSAATSPTNAGSATSKPGATFLETAARSLGAEISEYTDEGKANLARRSLSLPTVEFPGHLGKRGYSLSFPLKITNVSDSSLGLELDRVRFGEADILAKKAFMTLQAGRSADMDIPLRLPASLDRGEKQLEIELYFANGIRVSPQKGTLSFTLAPNPFSEIFRSGARILLFAIILVAALGLALLVFMLIKRIPRHSETPIVAAVLESASALGGKSRADSAKGSAGKPSAPPVTGTTAVVKSATANSSRPHEPRQAQTASILDETALERKKAVSQEADMRASYADAARSEAARSADLLAGAAAERSAAKRTNFAIDAATKHKEESASLDMKPRKGDRVPEASSDFSPRTKKPGTIQIELRVSGQNPHIGMRNIHILHAGTSKSVGGGRSDFSVFLVPVPRHAAELFFDGEDLTLVPRRGDLFPGIEGPVEHCLGKDIPMIGRGGYPLILRFARWERPADKINRLLHCIETPGFMYWSDTEG